MSRQAGGQANTKAGKQVGSQVAWQKCGQLDRQLGKLAEVFFNEQDGRQADRQVAK